MTRALLGVAGAAAVTSWALAPLTVVGVHLTAYLLAVVLAMSLVAVSRRLALQATAKTGVSSTTVELAAMRTVVLVAFLAGVFHSYYLARYLA